MPKFKAGDKLVDIVDNYANELEVVMLGKKQYVLEHDDDRLWAATFSYIESNYKLKSKFFQVSKSYQFSDVRNPTATYKIRDVITVDKPTDVYPDGMYALAMVVNPDGKQRMTVLNSGHFTDMKETA